MNGCYQRSGHWIVNSSYGDIHLIRADDARRLWRVMGTVSLAAGCISLTQAFNGKLFPSRRAAYQATCDALASYDIQLPSDSFRANQLYQTQSASQCISKTEHGWEISSYYSNLYDSKAFCAVFDHVAFPTRREATQAMQEWHQHQDAIV